MSKKISTKILLFHEIKTTHISLKTSILRVKKTSLLGVHHYAKLTIASKKTSLLRVHHYCKAHYCKHYCFEIKSSNLEKK